MISKAFLYRPPPPNLFYPSPTLFPEHTTRSPHRKEYKFLKEEMKNFRAFVEKERKEHRQFLEYHYTKSGNMVTIFLSILSAFGAVLTFLGIRSIRTLREQAKLEYQSSLKALISEQQQSTEEKLQALRSLIDQESLWRKARLAFFAEDAFHTGIQNKELTHFTSRMTQVHLQNPAQSINWDSYPYDVCIYRFNPTDPQEGIDPVLEAFIETLPTQDFTKIIPLVIYAPSSLRVKESTQEKLNEYRIFSIANNEITLVNNTSDAFRFRIR